MNVYLVPPVAVVGEPLEADDEDLRQHPEVELLGGLLVLLALGTVPGVVDSQLLLITMYFTVLYCADNFANTY